MNNIIVFTETLNEWIEPQKDAYYFLTDPPRKVGDEALIVVGETRFEFVPSRRKWKHLRVIPPRRVRVILCETLRTAKRCLWLVERP